MTLSGGHSATRITTSSNTSKADSSESSFIEVDPLQAALDGLDKELSLTVKDEQSSGQIDQPKDMTQVQDAPSSVKGSSSTLQSMDQDILHSSNPFSSDSADVDSVDPFAPASSTPLGKDGSADPFPSSDSLGADPFQIASSSQAISPIGHPDSLQGAKKEHESAGDAVSNPFTSSLSDSIPKPPPPALKETVQEPLFPSTIETPAPAPQDFSKSVAETSTLLPEAKDDPIAQDSPSLVSEVSKGSSMGNALVTQGIPDHPSVEDPFAAPENVPEFSSNDPFSPSTISSSGATDKAALNDPFSTSHSAISKEVDMIANTNLDHGAGTPSISQTMKPIITKDEPISENEKVPEPPLQGQVLDPESTSTSSLVQQDHLTQDPPAPVMPSDQIAPDVTPSHEEPDSSSLQEEGTREPSEPVNPFAFPSTSSSNQNTDDVDALFSGSGSGKGGAHGLVGGAIPGSTQLDASSFFDNAFPPTTSAEVIKTTITTNATTTTTTTNDSFSISSQLGTTQADPFPPTSQPAGSSLTNSQTFTSTNDSKPQTTAQFPPHQDTFPDLATQGEIRPAGRVDLPTTQASTGYYQNGTGYPSNGYGYGQAASGYGQQSSQGYGQSSTGYNQQATHSYGQASAVYSGVDQRTNQTMPGYGQASSSYGHPSASTYGQPMSSGYGQSGTTYPPTATYGTPQGGGSYSSQSSASTSGYGVSPTQAYGGTSTNGYGAAPSTQGYGGPVSTYGAASASSYGASPYAYGTPGQTTAPTSTQPAQSSTASSTKSYAFDAPDDVDYGTGRSRKSTMNSTTGPPPIPANMTYGMSQPGPTGGTGTPNPPLQGYGPSPPSIPPPPRTSSRTPRPSSRTSSHGGKSGGGGKSYAFDAPEDLYTGGKSRRVSRQASSHSITTPTHGELPIEGERERERWCSIAQMP